MLDQIRQISMPKLFSCMNSCSWIIYFVQSFWERKKLTILTLTSILSCVGVMWVVCWQVSENWVISDRNVSLIFPLIHFYWHTWLSVWEHLSPWRVQFVYIRMCGDAGVHLKLVVHKVYAEQWRCLLTCLCYYGLWTHACMPSPPPPIINGFCPYPRDNGL